MQALVVEREELSAKYPPATLLTIGQTIVLNYYENPDVSQPKPHVSPNQAHSRTRHRAGSTDSSFEARTLSPPLTATAVDLQRLKDLRVDGRFNSSDSFSFTQQIDHMMEPTADDYFTPAASSMSLHSIPQRIDRTSSVPVSSTSPTSEYELGHYPCRMKSNFVIQY